MTSRRQKFAKAVALILALSFMPLSGQAKLTVPRVNPDGPDSPRSVSAPGAPVLARLVTRRNQSVFVNGNGVGTGATILSGATIETPSEVRAVIQVGQLGSFDLAPNTVMVLEFSGDKLTGLLKQGCAALSTSGNVEGWVTTPNGMATKIDRLHGSSVNVCLPKGATTPIVGGEAAPSAVTVSNPASGGRGVFGLSPGLTTALVGAGSYVVGSGAIGSPGRPCCCCCCCCNPSPSSPHDCR